MISTGDLLISTPDSIGDYYFNRSIITLTEVNEEEIVGFIINKPQEYKLSDLKKTITNNNLKVYSGGPVKQDNLYFIHKKPKIIVGGINYIEDLHWGGDLKTGIEMINKNLIDDSCIKFFTGYSGWTYEQLEQEINDGAWILIKNKTEYLFNKNPYDLWGENMRKMGGEFKLWSNAPDNPQNN